MENLREIRVLHDYTFDHNGTGKIVRRGELLTVSSREDRVTGDIGSREAIEMVHRRFAEVPGLALEDDHA